MEKPEPLKKAESEARSETLPFRSGRTRLSHSLILWFFLLSMLPLVFVSWFSYQRAEADLTRAATAQLELAASLRGEFIHHWFLYRVADLTSQSESKINVQMLASLVEGLNASNKPLGDYVNSYDWVKRVEQYQNGLVVFSRRYDYVYDLFLIDTEGNILYSVVGESDLGTNLVSGPYSDTLFSQTTQVTLETGQVLFSDVERYSPSGDRLAGFLVAPLLDEGRGVVGAIAVQLRLDKTFNILKDEEHALDSGRHYLTGETGVLRSPIAGKWGEVLRRKIPLDNAGEERNVESEGDFAFQYLGPDGAEVLGVRRKLPVLNVNWWLISEVDTQEALASVFVLTKVVLALVTLTGIAVIVVAIFLARRITKPIVLLEEAARKVAAGETDQHVDVTNDNEIGGLAQAFNYMLQTQQEHERTLVLSNLRTEQALSELEEQKFALDQHAIVAITDVRGTITFANDKFSKISGYSKEELIGSNHNILNSGYHDEKFFRDLYLTISSGKVWVGEICNLTKGGSYYWVDTTVVPFMRDGKPQSYIAIRADITERKQADLATQEALLQLEAILESTDNGILVTSEYGNVIRANNRFAELWGIPSSLMDAKDEKAILGFVMGQLKDPQQFVRGVEKIHGNAEIEVADSLHFLDGRIYERCSLPMLQGGVYEGRVWTYRDVTDREKTQQELLEAKELAEQAVKVKGDFLASMSHEIRTPMNGVLGMLGLLLNTQLNEDQRRRVLIAQDSARSLLTLINDILDFSKVEAGKLVLESLDFDLRQVLGDFSESVAHQAQAKGLELVLDMKQVDESMVKGDPGRLRQILSNLVGNAIKFTSAGEVVVQAELGSQDENFWQFKCRIKDTGIGIPEEKISLLFDPFSQVDASTTRCYGGTGLGLAIVQKLCGLMGGGVSVSSEFGRGSTFDVNLLLEKSTLS